MSKLPDKVIDVPMAAKHTVCDLCGVYLFVTDLVVTVQKAFFLLLLFEMCKIGEPFGTIFG